MFDKIPSNFYISIAVKKIRFVVLYLVQKEGKYKIYDETLFISAVAVLHVIKIGCEREDERISSCTWPPVSQLYLVCMTAKNSNALTFKTNKGIPQLKTLLSSFQLFFYMVFSLCLSVEFLSASNLVRVICPFSIISALLFFWPAQKSSNLVKLLWWIQ